MTDFQIYLKEHRETVFNRNSEIKNYFLFVNDLLVEADRWEVVKQIIDSWLEDFQNLDIRTLAFNRTYSINECYKMISNIQFLEESLSKNITPSDEA